MLKSVVLRRSHTNLGARTVRQLETAGDEIGMNVSFENVRDADSHALRNIQVNVHISAGIDDRGNAGGVIANQI